MYEKPLLNKNLGKIARDKITGYIGRVTGFCQYLTGCDQYLVSPQECIDGKFPEAHWLDASRLYFLDGDTLSLNTETDSGPCEPAPKR